MCMVAPSQQDILVERTTLCPFTLHHSLVSTNVGASPSFLSPARIGDMDGAPCNIWKQSERAVVKHAPEIWIRGSGIPSFGPYEVAGTHWLLPTSESSCCQQVDKYAALGDVMPEVYLKLFLLYRNIYHLTKPWELSHWIFGVTVCQLREPRTLWDNAWSGYRWQDLQRQLPIWTAMKRTCL